MIEFNYDDLTMDYSFEAELEFTRIYKEMSNNDNALCEAACLKAILPHMMLPVQKGDWLVGRFRYRLVAVSPHYIVDGMDHVGYCADVPLMKKLLKHSGKTGVEYNEISKMIEFWEIEDCIPKITKRFTPLMIREMPYFDWENNSAAIFPLFRFAGAQLDFDKLIKLGFKGLIDEIERSKTLKKRTQKQMNLLNAMQDVIKTLVNMLAIYERELAQKLENCNDKKDEERFVLMLQTVKNLQVAAPQNFHEALQIVWFYTAFSGTHDFGRSDVYFGDLYVNDIDNGLITHQQALDYLLTFYRFSKEIITKDSRMILGGKGRRNEKNADRFALLAMEACAIHHESEPQLSLRMYKGLNEKVRQAGMDLLSTKMTYPLLFNDEASIHAVQKMMHVPLEEAEQYGFFGCGEYVITHKSMGTPNAIINLPKVLGITLNNGYDTVDQRETGLKTGNFSSFNTFEELFDAYKKQAEYFTKLAADVQKLIYDVTNESASMLFMSILSDDCIDRAKAVLDGGIRYLAGTYETYGNVTTADSLTAIKLAVYEKKYYTQQQLLTMLQADFKGYEKEQRLLLSLPKYGNENDIADEMVCRLNDHINEFTASQAERVGLASFLVVIINNSANTVLGKYTAATADGRNAFTYFSNGNCPMAGMDKSGLTAMLNSISKPDVSKTAGAAQNIKLSEELFTKHREKLNALLDTVFEKGLLSLSISVLSKKDLEMALIHPEKYQNLFVRVGGFSARFITLNPEVQRDVLNRTLY